MGDNAVLGATPLPERCGIGIAATPLLARTPIGPEDDTRTLVSARKGEGVAVPPSDV